MAKGKFYANRMTYRHILNGEPQVITACELVASRLAASASTQSGLIYTIDSQLGLNRVHTRVSTQGQAGRSAAGGEMYGRERAYNALAIALGQLGGNVRGGGGGYRTLKNRLAASARAANRKDRPRQTGWRAPSYRKSHF